MDRPQLIRRLRIAASVFFAVVTVALCVLWVRSYYLTDSLEIRTNERLFQVRSVVGRIVLWRYLPADKQYGQILLDEFSQGKFFATSTFGDSFWSLSKEGELGFFYRANKESLKVGIPYWFVVAVPIGLSMIPWLSNARRFSLRTLLIVTTLVAVVLGLGVWTAG
jgi:hypothetical protein